MSGGRSQVRSSGSRDPGNKKAAAWASTSGIDASTGTFAEAAKFGDVVVLSLLWEHAIQLAGPENFAGKVVIDTINPLVFNPGPSLAIGFTDSAGETVQRLIPEAHVVKAFNIVGHAHMFKPDFPGGPPDMFICGKATQSNVTAHRQRSRPQKVGTANSVPRRHDPGCNIPAAPSWTERAVPTFWPGHGATVFSRVSTWPRSPYRRQAASLRPCRTAPVCNLLTHQVSLMPHFQNRGDVTAVFQ